MQRRKRQPTIGNQLASLLPNLVVGSGVLVLVPFAGLDGGSGAYCECGNRRVGRGNHQTSVFVSVGTDGSGVGTTICECGNRRVGRGNHQAPVFVSVGTDGSGAGITKPQLL